MRPAPKCRDLTNACRIAIAITLAVATTTGCGRKKRRIPTPAPITIPAEEIGIASWYGHPYHGRRTASGEVYDMDLFTAAHRTRPFDTWVRVHNLENGKTVDVRINDRGPFVDGRIIDLSRVAARTIDMIGPGTARVKLVTIFAPSPATEVVAAREAKALTEAPRSEYWFGVQVGAFGVRENADRVHTEMELRYGLARIMFSEGDPPVWRVIVGSELDAAAAEALARTIRDEYGPAYVVRVGADDEVEP